jgi:trimeric autotransporter adhesin
VFNQEDKTMKNLLLGAVSAVALLTAGGAFAAGNASTIDQIGTGNTAAVDQTGSPSDAVATITQGLANSDANNSASVTQGGGAGNVATVTQSQGPYAVNNPSNRETSNQQGTGGVVTVIQVGDNTSTVQQLSGSIDEVALVGQSDVGNSSSISQGGTSEFALVNQEEGTGNSAGIVQSGTGAGDITPTDQGVAHGPNNLYWSENVPDDSVLPGASSGLTTYGETGAVVDQVGSNNVGAINQAGFQNFADVSQENDTSPGGNTGTVSQGAGLFQSDGVMYQLGQNNGAAINQSGSGTTYSTIWQNGNLNQAYSTQVGSETSVIGQGVTGDGPRTSDDSFVTAVNNDYAAADQTSGNDNSLITQTGDSDTANVFQTVTANATSTIMQGGSNNTATVRQ